MTAYQVISVQPNRSDRHESVISAATITADNPATNVGIDTAQTAETGNVPDYRANLALVTAYLMAATKRDYAPLYALKRTIGIRNGIGMPDTVRTGSGKVRPHLERLTRLRQIRLYAMGWKRLLRSNQEDDPRIAQAFFASAELLHEIMKK